MEIRGVLWLFIGLIVWVFIACGWKSLDQIKWMEEIIQPTVDRQKSFMGSANVLIDDFIKFFSSSKQKKKSFPDKLFEKPSEVRNHIGYFVIVVFWPLFLISALIKKKPSDKK